MLCTDDSGLFFLVFFYTQQGDGSVVGRIRGVARLGDGCNSCVFPILWYFSGSEVQIVRDGVISVAVSFRSRFGMWSKPGLLLASTLLRSFPTSSTVAAIAFRI